MIRQGIIEGMQLEKMPVIEGHFNPMIHSRREMDGYAVENIAIESFPGFWITGNLYTPLQPREKNPAVLCPHGHAPDKRLKPMCRSGVLPWPAWVPSSLPTTWWATESR